MIDRVDLYAGGYPARFGRFAGGIVAGETSAPRKDFHGEANVRLVDTGALAESGFAEDRGSVLVGGRYSYTGLLLTLISPEVDLQYWDYQTRIAYDLSSRDTLGVFGFGSFDYLGENQNGKTETLFSTQFHRLDLRWTHTASANTRFDLALTGGVDRTNAGEEDFTILDRMIGVRGRVTRRAGAETLLRAGADVNIDGYSLEYRNVNGGGDTDFAQILPTRNDVSTGLWVDAVLDAAPRVSVTPGLRLDLYTSRGFAALGIDPRISALYKVKRSVRLVHAFGLASQPPAFAIPIPGFQLSNLEDGLQRSVQSSAGVELDLPKDFGLTFTVFQNAFFDMTDVIGTDSFDDDGPGDSAGAVQPDTPGAPPQSLEPEERRDNDVQRLLNRSLGSAVGAELAIHRSLSERFGGYLSYTLSRSTRSLGREHFPSTFDRTHVLNVAGAYDLGKRWRAGSRVTLYTGRPSSETDAAGRRPPRPNRLPPFFRLDVRLEKRWRLGERGYWAFVLEVLNTTLSKEVLTDSCGSDGPCEQEAIGPVTIPSIGLEAFF
jgi:hypothetical protein